MYYIAEVQSYQTGSSWCSGNKKAVNTYQFTIDIHAFLANYALRELDASVISSIYSAYLTYLTENFKVCYLGNRLYSISK